MSGRDNKPKDQKGFKGFDQKRVKQAKKLTKEILPRVKRIVQVTTGWTKIAQIKKGIQKSVQKEIIIGMRISFNSTGRSELGTLPFDSNRAFIPVDFFVQFGPWFSIFFISRPNF